MTRAPAPDPHAALRDELREAGLRCTAPRLDVLAALRHARGPVSHPELCEVLAPQGYDRATVYRNLMALTERGLARRADLGDHVWRFEAAAPAEPDPHDHVHFLCDACGEVTCVEGAAVALPAVAVGEVREVVLKGTCLGCG